MRIDRLYVKNFRNFAESQFYFNQHFTVVIGVNGRGKSSILHALRVAAGTYLLGIPTAAKRHIQADEVRVIPSPSGKSIRPAPGEVVVEAEGEVGSYIGYWRRRLPQGAKRTTSGWDDVGAVRLQAQSKSQKINEQGLEEIDNPVIAYFGTGRYWAPAHKRAPKFPGKQILRDGYYDWADLKSGSFKYLSWRTAYAALLADNRESPGLDTAFDEAILTAIPYINQLYIDSEYGLWVKAKVEDVQYDLLPLHYQSDGIKMMTQMVAELAYRCVTLNGHHGAEAVRASHGLVLIDELDLHLHPNWQRHVVADLRKAFPNIQFVATTHSPFIVQSLATDELINLDGPGPDVAPSALRIDEVAGEVMGVDSPYSEASEQAEQEAFVQLSDPIPPNPDNLPISNAALRAMQRLELLAKNAERNAAI